MGRFLAVGFFLTLLPFQFFLEVESADAGEAKSLWQIEWEKTLAAAYKEGEVAVYGRPGSKQRDAFNAFEETYPQIKLKYDFGGGQNAQRLFAERRAGKYIADVALVGAATGMVFFNGNTLDPIPPVLVLPENRDPSLWFEKRHPYADSKNEYIFIMAGGTDSLIGAYNIRLVDPKEIRSHWDLLNPKWRGKIVAYDPAARGHMSNWKAIYYHPRIGGKFIRRFLSEMNVTLGRDQRLMLDWVANGKFPLVLPVNSTDVREAKKQGLPVDLLEAPPGEGYISSASGHVVLINRAPHPNAAKVLVNWLLSRRGQLEWQKKVDDNSLRTDIPKEMLSDPRSIPKEGVEYLMASLYQYSDVGPLLQVVREALASARKN